MSIKARRHKKNLKKFLIDRDGGKCRKCGSTQDLTIDHIVPKKYGGGSTRDNLQILCGSCNNKKGHRLPQGYAIVGNTAYELKKL